MTPFVAGCPISIPYTTISAWRDHELSDDQAQQMQDHIQNCAACRRYLADLELTGQAVKRHLPPANVQDAIWRDVRATITAQRGAMKQSQKTLALTGTGAAAIIIALIAVVLVSLTNKPATTQKLPTMTPALHSSPLVAVLLTGAGSGPPPSSLVGYDGATGQIRFRHQLQVFSHNNLAASPKLMGVLGTTNTAAQPLSTSLQLYDATGALARQIPLGALAPSLLLASNDTFFVGGTTTATILKATAMPTTSLAQISAYAADSGTQRWQQVIPNATDLAQFTLAGNELIGVGENPAGSSQLTAINAVSGKLDWQIPFDASASIVTSGNMVYSLIPAPIASQTAGQQLVAYSAATGVVRWRKQFTVDTASEPHVQFVAADQNAVYAAAIYGTPTHASKDALLAFAAGDGQPVWSVPGEQFIINATGQASPIVDGVLYATIVATSSASATPTLPTIKLVGVQVATGATLWSAPLAGYPLAAPTVAGATIYVGVQTTSQTGSPGNAAIAAFSTTGSLLWQTPTSASYTSPLVALP